MNGTPDPVANDPRLLVKVQGPSSRRSRVLAWLLALRRRPCPHCHRRSGRDLTNSAGVLGRIRPQALLYACRSCGGLMRYARQTSGHEYWERADDRPELPLRG